MQNLSYTYDLLGNPLSRADTMPASITQGTRTISFQDDTEQREPVSTSLENALTS